MPAKDPQELWRITLAQLEVKIDSPAQYKTFFRGAKLLDFSQGKAVIGLQNGYVMDWIKQRRYDQMIKDTISHVYGKEIKVELTVNSTLDSPQSQPQPESFYESPLLSMQNGLHNTLIELLRKAGLNEKYSLGSFVVGDSNRIAHAAATATIDNPGKAYNPLFLHGKTGLGKTHLAQSIARSVLERNPGYKVLYTSSENFLNEMVSGLRNQTMHRFRAKFRELNILILDDIQLISKWVKTQDEFFNAFNELQQGNHQIILISDRPPEEIQDLEDRLRSRFRGGIVVDIGEPDYELRLAILSQRNNDMALGLNPRLIDVIARGVSDNIRELEGALQKVALFNSMKPDGELSAEEVAHLIGADKESKQEKLKVPNVLKRVATEFGVTVKDLKGDRRTKDIAFARQVAMYILREELGYKLEEVAGYLNKQDHTTVLHGVEKIKSQILTTDAFKQQIVQIIRDLNESPLKQD